MLYGDSFNKMQEFLDINDDIGTIQKADKTESEIQEDIKKIISEYSPSKIEIGIQLANSGIDAKHEGRFQNALQYYKKVIEMFPETGMIYYNLGKIFYIIGDYEHARRAYTIAYIYNANVFDHNLFKHLGHAIYDETHQNRASNEYRKSIAGQLYDPNVLDDSSSYIRIAKDNIQSLCKKYEEAVIK